MAERAQRQPWERRDGETAKAHAAFLEYLRLGYGQRSIDKAWAQQKGSRSTADGRAPRHWLRWSNEHEWVARADAYDAHELAEEMAARANLRERIRGAALAEGLDAVGVLAKIMRGQGSYTETGAPASKDEIAAAESLLALGGVSPPKSVEVTGKDGAPLVPTPRPALDADTLASLTAEQLERRFRERMGDGA